MWTSKHSLLEVIRNVWKQEVSGPSLSILCSKLLATKQAIREWNKTSFRNVFKAVRRAKKGVLQAEIGAETDASEEAQLELNKA